MKRKWNLNNIPIYSQDDLYKYTNILYFKFREILGVKSNQEEFDFVPWRREYIHFFDTFITDKNSSAVDIYLNTVERIENTNIVKMSEEKKGNLNNKLEEFLTGLSREEIIVISKSWAGHRGVNYTTTETKDLISLIIDAITL